jgi:signal transduction histidine kinase
MTGSYLVDWPVMTVSLFNTILLVWLGLTVLLNAERRAWAIWLAGGGLLAGGIFFISHSAILGLGLTYVEQGMNFWWRVAWLPVVASPFAWYIVMLWYAGFWDHPQSRLRHRHRLWLVVAILWAAGLIGFLIIANPLSPNWQTAQLNLAATPALAGVPVILLVYPLYNVLCISLALDVMRHPEPSGRLMGDLARTRARPWLIATSIVLLVVSLLVAWVMLWIVLNVRQRSLYNLYTDMVATVAWFDLVIASLIAISVVLLGQAVVSYELFTGKTLPRRGLRRQWHRAIILAAGFSLVIGWGLTIQLRSIYGLILSALVITIFHALLSWRSYAERNRYIDRLRPFVTSEGLYDRLLTETPAASPTLDAEPPFQALCEDILGAQTAYLSALGPLAPLVGPPLVYPTTVEVRQLAIADLRRQFDTPHKLYVPLDATQWLGFRWATPLWSERGLIGVLLLGDKREGGLYTQEEIEIARASGERLIDTLASAEMARRLMALQRQRMAQEQVLDRRTRRTLHDEVLPQLHTAMLTLSSGGAGPNGASDNAVTMLTEVHHQISDLLREMPPAVVPTLTRLGLIGALRQTVETEFVDAFDSVSWQVDPKATRQVEGLPQLTAEVLYYAAREVIRNAARHGRTDPAKSLALTVSIDWTNELLLLIEDNGVGLPAAGQANGTGGQGLALHSTMLAVVGGSLTIESAPDTYTRALITLPHS